MGQGQWPADPLNSRGARGNGGTRDSEGTRDIEVLISNPTRPPITSYWSSQSSSQWTDPTRRPGPGRRRADRSQRGRSKRCTGRGRAVRRAPPLPAQAGRIAGARRRHRGGGRAGLFHLTARRLATAAGQREGSDLPTPMRGEPVAFGATAPRARAAIMRSSCASGTRDAPCPVSPQVSSR